MIPTAPRSSTPIPSWIRRRGQPETTPAPSQAPAVAAPIMSVSVFASTSTAMMRMEMTASAKVGIMWPTLSVPGMFSSATTPPSLKSEVVGANDPIPSMSKKSVTIPIPSWRMVGRRRPGRAGAPAGSRTATNAIPAAPSSAIRIAFGLANG